MKINKKLILASLLTSFFLFGFVSSSLADNYGLDKTISAGNKLEKAFSVNAVGSSSEAFLSTRVGSIIGTLLSFLGVIFMVLVIYAGVLWMTARGAEAQVDKAKDILVNAIIGLILVLAAYAITAFVGGQLTDIQPATTQQ
jgi:cbb3-type cytochrome oxidase subunit 3